LLEKGKLQRGGSMNLLRKSDRVDVFFYEEDSVRDAQSLRGMLEEISEMIESPKVRVKFSEVHSFRFESLALVFSFIKTLKLRGVFCEMTVPKDLEHFLLEFRLGKIPDSIEKEEE
jgi:hypothetical protein